MSEVGSRAFSWGEEATRFFFELTPEKILSAVETTGVSCTGRCLQLASMENRVYELEIETNDSKTLSDRFRIVKFYRPGRWSAEQIQDEHNFLFDLVEYDIPVVAPLRDEEGKSFHEMAELGIYFSVFPKVGGRNPDELDNESLAIVGRLLARMHNVGQTREASNRIFLDPETYGYNSLDFLLENGSLPGGLQDEYESLVEEICEASFKLFEAASIQRVHGDCHLGNLLWGEKGPFWVDFDDMVNAPCVQDIWMVVPGRDEFAIRQREQLINSYEQMRSFDWNEINLIEPLRTLRMIHFNAWIAKRWEDPYFPKSFPEFGSDKYWLEQLQTLREQAELIL